MDLNLIINELIVYAKVNFKINEEDEIFYRNLILGELNITSFNKVEVNEEKISSFNDPSYFIENLSTYLKENGLNEDEIDKKLTKIFGFLSPLPSEVIKEFNEIYEKKGDERALKYLYFLSIKNDYIKKSKIDKNLVWLTNFKDKNLEITINLSKPEKNNKDIAKLLTKTDDKKYPECLLCKENVGFYGNKNHPARENIRLIPISLNNETWYLQYSPYGYFNMHSIILKSEHSNMKIDKETFSNLLEFVDKFPYFFIGSNADLPIVGGSILNHEHYQGGEHRLPIMDSKIKKPYFIDQNKHSSKLSLLDWYNTAFLIEGEDKKDIVEIADEILKKWRNYDDIKNNIISHSGETLHNSITPCCEKDGDTYKLYLILRNNRCDETYPEGIFHAHKEYHHIKSEGIGIIEAMGLFILPPRLKREIEEIKYCVENRLSSQDILNKYPSFNANFMPLIDQLKKKNKKDVIDEEIRNYINEVCKNILINTAVFKDDMKGRSGVDKFVSSLDL